MPLSRIRLRLAAWFALAFVGGLVVLTGGVFRQRDPAGLGAVVSTLRADAALAPLLGDARVVVDGDFAVVPAGLLAASDRADAAVALLRDHLLG